MLSMYARSLSRASARSARSPPLLALAARTARSVPAVAAQRRLLCDASGGPSSGVVTALDILRSVSGARYTMDDPLRASIGEGEPISAAIHRMVRPHGDKSRPGATPEGWNVPVSSVMTPAKDLVYLSPSDTLDEVRSLMALSGRRHIPVLAGSTLLGILNPKDIAKYIHLQRNASTSAKSDFVQTVMPRKGVPIGTKLTRGSGLAGRGGAAAGTFLEPSWNRPVGSGLAAEAALQLYSAVALLPHPAKTESGGEDAFLLGPHMIGVADSTGREGGIDPAAYARGLMFASRNSCASLQREEGLLASRRSSTACLVSLDPHKTELRAANIGDSGFLLLRRQAPDSGDAPDDRFETPQDSRLRGPGHDASLVRVPVRPGDILVLATDGLFDNVDEEALLDTIEDLIEGSGTGASPQQLADAIAARAKELSLDKSVDSPFAILAKDNDILWGGGRPDDITVLVSHILDRADARAPPTDWAAVSGPGEPPPELLEAEALLAAERLAAEARTASGLGAERGEEEEVERLEEEARVGASR
ncbi:Hypothetical protein EMIHUDRAFT_449869 [Emiliania huxleyi CCMP1516]|uniref:Protein phosphatase n=2 Tax=Emiliania huxleyi TaxID=2903 RepID=A0A0D3K0Q5_EMIH1|nr:Hypothetical protein EMIHUDRAFT_449869 [Emiliania huxleyi CCMP1516]EOD29340.1 Hypothetical protein EMIHUDRAFT_449869 [Emiliania huxleyi CCMP1516]|eukprot:XP_005781769.1 Hypothetical protein EMIHUDRAFT_449869 [Emiliania huxleyi CCMP1516]